MTAECIFCRIIAGEIPAQRVHEDDRVLVFRDIQPQAPVHLLVIPKRHIATLNDLTPDDTDLIGHMYLTAARVAASEGFAEAGYRCLINTNRDGGQDVFHVHMHVLAGRRMGWPPG